MGKLGESERGCCTRRARAGKRGSGKGRQRRIEAPARRAQTPRSRAADRALRRRGRPTEAMMLVVTARGPLESRYGAAGYQTLRALLENYAQEASARLLALDDPADMEPVGVAPAALNPGSLLLAIRSVRSVQTNIDR